MGPLVSTIHLFKKWLDLTVPRGFLNGTGNLTVLIALEWNKLKVGRKGNIVNDKTYCNTDSIYKVRPCPWFANKTAWVNLIPQLSWLEMAMVSMKPEASTIFEWGNRKREKFWGNYLWCYVSSCVSIDIWENLLPSVSIKCEIRATKWPSSLRNVKNRELYCFAFRIHL